MKYMEEILGRVCRVMGEYERDRTPVEDGYNIFRVLDVADKEVMVCRMLADIVDPAGGHGQGDRFLRTFVEKVLGLSAGEEFFHEAEVIREYRIPESFSGRRNRRIDLVIRSKDWFIPIEVKIKVLLSCKIISSTNNASSYPIAPVMSSMTSRYWEHTLLNRPSSSSSTTPRSHPQISLRIDSLMSPSAGTVSMRPSASLFAVMLHSSGKVPSFVT